MKLFGNNIGNKVGGEDTYLPIPSLKVSEGKHYSQEATAGMNNFQKHA